MINHHHTITRWLVRAAKRWPLLAVLAGACVLDSTVTAAADPTKSAHGIDIISPYTLCGFTGTLTEVFDFGPGPAGAGMEIRTFVADNGRGVKITYQAGNLKALSTVTYPDGSSAVTLVEDGSVFKTQALGGPVLEQSTGRAIFTAYFDPSGNFVSQTVDSTSGPENASAPDCSIIGPYLAGV
jgi:hypothetical protein